MDEPIKEEGRINEELAEKDVEIKTLKHIQSNNMKYINKLILEVEKLKREINGLEMENSFKCLERSDNDINAILEWFKSKDRKPAQLNWTASPARQVGYILQSLDFEINDLNKVWQNKIGLLKKGIENNKWCFGVQAREQFYKLLDEVHK